jgi:acyl carrier protein
MTSESTIATQIRTALAQHLKRDVSNIRPQDRLREDLGLDSLAMIELLFKIEEHFDLEIPNEDLSRVTTVADVTVYVEEKLGATAAPAAPAKAARALGEVKPQASRANPEERPSGARRPAAKPAPPARLPAKVTSIKVAAKRKAAQASPKAAAKKKGSRRA